MKKNLSVIIVAYNSEEFISKCISSILKFLPKNCEVIVVDNNSNDGTLDMLRKFQAKIKILEPKANLGFAKAANLASAEAYGEYFFILNPDTEIKSNIFDELIEFYGSDENIGIVSPKLITPNGKIQASAKKEPTVFGAFKEFVLGIKNSYSFYTPETNDPIEVNVVYGAAILIKRDLFEKLKGYDEKFFVYYEDIDLCKRVRDLGKKIYYYPKVQVKHLGGGTKSEADKNKLNFESSLKYHNFIIVMILQLIFFIPRLRRKLRLD